MIDDEVKTVIENKGPIVALESTLITHGLPYPDNIKIALEMEAEVRKIGATPATIVILDGIIHVGLRKEDLEKLGDTRVVRKVSTREIASTIVSGTSGGTTVAATTFIANRVGIKVFATGGIGGVHRTFGEEPVSHDVSADLIELSRNPIIVVCAGAKAILDIPATLENLESLAVPVIGFGIDEFPAFYTRSSGYPAGIRVDTPHDIARMAKSHWGLGLNSAFLVANPLPEADSVPDEFIEKIIIQALVEAESQGIKGQDVTPYLLNKVSELTEGASMEANLKLLRNNALLAAEIAIAYWQS